MIRGFGFVFALGALLVPVARADATVGATVSPLFELQVTSDASSDTIDLRLALGDPTHIEVYEGAILRGSFLRSGIVAIRVLGNGGNDTIRLTTDITEPARLEGGPGGDVISGGGGNDFIYGGVGSDLIAWRAGGGNDFVEGEGDPDTLIVEGSNEAEQFYVEPNGLRLRITGSPGNVVLDVGSTEGITFHGNGGNDGIGCGGNLAALIGGIVALGGPGDDTLRGCNGVDVLGGDTGNDDLAGDIGNDAISGGAGDDFISWDPGHGSDNVNGGDGNDWVYVNGTTANEDFNVTFPAATAVIIRGAQVIQSLISVEKIQIHAFQGNDVLAVTGNVPGVNEVIFNGMEGEDTLTGGNTHDTLIGGPGIDIINGGGGNDTITPGPGDELAVTGGAGDDLFIWNDGDGADGFDGQAGADRIEFNGSAAGETLTIALDMGGIRVNRNGSGVLGFKNTERIDFFTAGGADRLSIGANLHPAVDIRVDLGAGADTLDTTASSKVIANGNTEIDALNFNAENQKVITTPSAIEFLGVARVTHSNVEQINFLNSLTQPPTITITSPTSDPSMTARSAFITLAGTAADDTGITAVHWNTNRFFEGSITQGTTSWTAPDIPLAPGSNTIRVVVHDTSGNQTMDTLVVNVPEFSYTMAEGATGGFFDSDVLLANPNSVAAPVTITYLKGDGTTVTQQLDLPATSRTTIALDSVAGLDNAEVSTTVTSTNAVPLVVERTMRWDATGYGAHTERATDAPAKTWFFAEGSQGFFDTYVLLANPGAVSNDATITFLLENGAPVVKTFTLAPTSRQTIGTNAIPELLNQSFGIVVSFAQPGVAERAMYFSTPGTPVFNAGHESAGVNAASTSWFLAEGATGSFFTTFVLLANPGTSDATATVTFLPATGAAVTKTHTVQAGRRLTLNIAAEDASLADAAVATQVTSTQPILVERAQYWPSTPDKWYEAHNSFGGTALGEKWGLAEGRVGGPEAYQTYILLANPDPTQTSAVTVTFLRTNGTTVTKTYSVGPTSRFNIHVNSMVPELANESFGAVIEVTDGPTIFVERALYSDQNGVAFAAGTNALATRLTPEPLHP